MTPYTSAYKQQLESLPYSDRPWPASPYSWLQEQLLERRDKQAVEFFLRARDFRKPHTLTYGDLLTGINQTAQLLQGLGVHAEDTIAVILPQVPEFLMAIWGSMLTAQVIILDPASTTDHMTTLLKRTAPKVLVTLGPYPGYELWEKMEEVREVLPSLKTILQVDLNAYLGRVKRWQARRILRSRGKAEPIPTQKIGDFNITRSKFSGDLPEDFPLPTTDQVAVYVEGRGQLLKYTHRQICAMCWGIQQVLPSSKGKTLWGESSTSLAACLIDGLLPMIDGSPILIPGLQGFHSEETMEKLGDMCAYYSIDRMRIGAGSLLYVGELDDDRLPKEWIIDHGWIPTSVLTADQSRSYWQMLRSDRGQVCGLSHLDSLESLAGRIVPPLLPYMQVDPVLPADGSFRLPLNGEFFQAGQGEDTIGLRFLTGDQWQDLGGEDLMFYEGTFSALDVESVLNTHPTVYAAIVVRKEGPDQQHIPIAFIQLRPGDQTGPKEVYEFVKEHLPEDQMVPKGIRIVDVLPRTSNGAMNRSVLYEQENSG
ncbi:MAG: AMP-binding protein [Bacteroidota bacterium]